MKTSTILKILRKKQIIRILRLETTPQLTKFGLIISKLNSNRTKSQSLSFSDYFEYYIQQANKLISLNCLKDRKFIICYIDQDTINKKQVDQNVIKLNFNTKITRFTIIQLKKLTSFDINTSLL